TRFRHRHVDVEPIAPVEVIPALHFVLCGRNDHRFRARVLERLLRLDHLDLLEAFRDENSDSHSIEIHGVSCLRLSFLSRKKHSRPTHMLTPSDNAASGTATTETPAMPSPRVERPR